MARLGPAPRSAAGPDLRQALFRRAVPEAVEIPIVPLGPADRSTWHIRSVTGEGPTPEDVRPTWRSDHLWGFLNEELASTVGRPTDPETTPERPPVAPGPGLRLDPPGTAT